jgi:hypothetical protein
MVKQYPFDYVNISGFVLAEQSDGSDPDSSGGKRKSIKVVLEKFA